MNTIRNMENCSKRLVTISNTSEVMLPYHGMYMNSSFMDSMTDICYDDNRDCDMRDVSSFSYYDMKIVSDEYDKISYGCNVRVVRYVTNNDFT